ncbi:MULTISPECIES: hypothetical protein [unclassified Novosphingobium]|uniref:hypothetical protein n=1 Tax=unclassified Novosphingobium TaxID=2644732 RepID=UPI00135A6A4E|nr:MULTISPECIES: hypothetical protein [unclassified Novosphingobium]
MHEIKNLTNSPQDLESLEGVKRLPAMGSVKGKFEPEYLEALRGAGMYEVAEVKGPGRPKKD